MQLRYVTFFDFNNIETGKRKRKFVFSAMIEGDIVLSHEHSEYKWSSLQTIATMRLQSKCNPYEMWDDHYTAIMQAAQ
jgi:hypothetical protein